MYGPLLDTLDRKGRGQPNNKIQKTGAHDDFKAKASARF